MGLPRARWARAASLEIEADSIRAINDAFRITRLDGSVDEEASAALVAQLKESLGLDYTEGTVADDIHTRFIKEKKGFGVIQSFDRRLVS